MIKVYRFEDINGDGPFIKRDGHPNICGYISVTPNNILSACLSIEELIEWFNQRHINITDSFYIVEYTVKKIYNGADHIYFNVDDIIKKERIKVK